MDSTSIKCLADLNMLRSAPKLTRKELAPLLKELKIAMLDAEWFTLGIMADSKEIAMSVLKNIEKLYGWTTMTCIELPNENGPVFLKANQKNGEVRIRIEYGLGEGVLISSHHSDIEKPSSTWGPLPLEAFQP